VRFAALSLVGLALAAVLVSGVGRAQNRDEAGAEALFQQGRVLMDQGALEQACKKFDASETLDPAVGTLLNLGDCLERSGKTASAWARFHEAEAMATEQHQADRASAARGRSAALDAKLCRVIVRAPHASESTSLSVSRDDVTLEPSLYGAALPVDPGPHAIFASAPRHEPWSVRVEVDARTCAGAPVVVEIPKLRAMLPGPAAPARNDATAPSPGAATAARSGTTQRVAAWGVGGLGLATLATSGVLAIDALTTYHGAQNACVAGGCGSAAQSKEGTAGTLADAATATLAIGASATAVGLLLWLTAPSGPAYVSPEMVPSLHGGRVGVVARLAF